MVTGRPGQNFFRVGGRATSLQTGAAHRDMTAAPTKPRALRRLAQLHDAKALGRDKAQGQRLQKTAAEP